MDPILQLYVLTRKSGRSAPILLSLQDSVGASHSAGRLGELYALSHHVQRNLMCPCLHQSFAVLGVWLGDWPIASKYLRAVTTGTRAHVRCAYVLVTVTLNLPAVGWQEDNNKPFTHTDVCRLSSVVETADVWLTFGRMCLAFTER